MRNLAVVIPSRSDRNLTACYGAICAFDPAVARRVIVVDDGVPDVWADSVELVKGEQPFCFASNANMGILTAGRADVILCNDDAVLETPGGFSAMQRFAEEHPEIGLVSAKTNRCNHQMPLSLSFVCVLIPRRTIDLVGLLDERFIGEIDGEMVYGGEDDDYCYRVRQAGLKLAIFDRCVVDHSRLKSTFRPHGGGLPINATRKRFREIHGFEMRLR